MGIFVYHLSILSEWFAIRIRMEYKKQAILLNPIFTLMKKLKLLHIAITFLFTFSFTTITLTLSAQASEYFEENVRFKSEGIYLAGTIYKPENPKAAVVIVHGSDQVPRMTKFAELLAEHGVSVLTYDKRGVGESEGIYAGPEVGTNNIDSTNLTLLARDVSAAVDILHELNDGIPIGLLGFSQAGWIMPIAACKNPFVEFMVLFSCPTITTLEQLRFQFYTNGNSKFWDSHTEEDARYHLKNDPDKYQFITTDPKDYLNDLNIPGLWLFGEKDIQIPARLCIEQLNTMKVKGKPFEYALFSNLGHNTAFAISTEPVDIAIQWIKREAEILETKPKKASIEAFFGFIFNL